MVKDGGGFGFTYFITNIRFTVVYNDVRRNFFFMAVGKNSYNKKY